MTRNTVPTMLGVSGLIAATRLGHMLYHAVFQACSRSPVDIDTERNFVKTIQHQEAEMQKLQDRVSVLAHAKETDARRFKQIAVERQREREDLKREVERLKVRLYFLGYALMILS